MYLVVFRYTKKAGHYEGVVTQTGFESKKDFDKWYTPDIKEREAIVEEGVTEERAVELVHQTPFACYIAAATKESMDENGIINMDLFKMHITGAIFIENHTRKSLGLPLIDGKIVLAPFPIY